MTWSGSQSDRVLVAITNWYLHLYWSAISFSSDSWVCRLFLKYLLNNQLSRGLFWPSHCEAGKQGVAAVEVVEEVVAGLGLALTVEVVVVAELLA